MKKKCEDVFIGSDYHLTYCFVSCRKNKIADVLFYYQMKIKNLHIELYPGEEVRFDSGRKTTDIAGTWKQYSDRKFYGLFPMISCRKAQESNRKSQSLFSKSQCVGKLFAHSPSLFNQISQLLATFMN